MLRSLKVTDGWLKRVKQALSRYDFSSQKALADELEIPSRKASDFFNGKSVESEVFIAICTRLGLDWQKVAKVSTEIAKGSADFSKVLAPKLEISVELSSKIHAQIQKSEGIPKLASSLFSAFDSQEHIAQKKFVNVPTVLSENPFDPKSSQTSEQSLNQLIEEAIVDQVIDESKNIDEIEHIDKAKNEDKEKDSRRDFIPETAITPVTELISKSSEASLENNQVILNTSSTQIQEMLGIDTSVPANSSDALNPKTIAQIQELLGMVASPNQTVPSAQVLVREPLSSKSAIESQRITLEEKLTPSKSPQQELIKPVVSIIKEEIFESEPKFSPPPINDLEPILIAYYGACQNQDWDTAAAIVNGINLARIKKTSDLAVILDLFNQLLPLKWQDGEQKISDRLSHWYILANAGLTAFYLGKYQDALGYYETALAIAPKLEANTPLKIKALNGLGMVYQAVTQSESAIKYFQQSQVLAKETQDYSFQLQALGNLGNVYYVLRQYRTAISYYQEFLELANSEKPTHDLVEIEFSTIGNLGNAYYNLKEYQRAINYQQKYLEIAQTTGNIEKEAGCLVSLGFSYYSLGLYQTAIENFHNARAIADRHTYQSYQRTQLSIFSGLGFSYQALKNYSTSVVCFHKCLEAARQVGDRSAEVKALYNLRKVNSYQDI